MKLTSVAVALTALLAGTSLATAQTKPLVAFAMPSIQGGFWVSMYYGVTEEAKALGFDIAVVDSGGFDRVAKQVEQIENLAQRKPQVMLVGATNAAGVKSAVERVIEAGIPVVGLGSIPEPMDKLASIVLADHYALGRLQAECLSEKLGGKGNVGVMVGPPGVGWAADRARGFKESLAKIAPEMKVVVEKATVPGRTEGLKLMEDWLQGFPGIAGVYTVDDDMGAGAVDALVQARLEGKVKISSSNLSPIGDNYLRKGFLQCESIQQIVLQGREAVRQAAKIMKGEAPTKLIKTPAVLVTAENVDKLDYSEIKAPRDFRPR